jgi:P27 family predicted phage terminase small subunit
MTSGRNRLPASMKQGKSETKEHLDKRADLEAQMAGEANQVYSIIPNTLDEGGKQWYTFIVQNLENISNILGDLDIPLVTQTADALSKMDQANKSIERNGLMIEIMDKNGNILPKKNPAVDIYKMYNDIFVKLSSQLGMSPSARAQLAELKMSEASDEKDPLLAALGDDD